MTSSDVVLDGPAWQRAVAEAALSLAIGWLVWVGSCWLVAPLDAIGGGFEVDWQLMSVDPFALAGRFPHRILVPFLAWLCGFGGDGWLQFTRGLHVLLLGSVCFVVLRHRGALLDALLVTVMVGITAPTQMYKLHWNGYADPICYTLFLWAMIAARNPAVFWSLFFLNLMNHELAVFLLPWLWFLRRRNDRRFGADLVGAGVALAAYGAFYVYVKQTAAPMFNVDYFVAHPLFPGGTFAVWNLAAVHWTCAYGPVLAVLAWHQHRRESGRERWHLWLVLGSILAIFCIAFDWARHSNLIVLPLVLAAMRFLACGNLHRVVFVGLLALAQGLFWLVPPWESSAWPTSLFANHVLLVETGLVVPGPGPGLDIGFGPLSAALGKWLPAIWLPLAILHLILAAMLVVGWWLARWLGDLRAPGTSVASMPA